MNRESLFADRRQKRIREQLRDGIAEVREREATIERDKRARSIRQYLLIDEVEALLDHIDGLERDQEFLVSSRDHWRELAYRYAPEDVKAG